MGRLAANLSTIFCEYPFLERFKKAKEAGFSAVECQLPYDHSIISIQQELDKHGLTMVLINLPPGNWNTGDRGIAIFPERKEEFRQSVATGIRYAKAFGTDRIHCLAGVLPVNMDRQLAKKTFVENLIYAAKELALHRLTLMIEPINSNDMENYFLSDINEAIHIIEEIGLPNVQLQFDFYHIERIHGNVLSLFERYLDKIGHVQIADFPGRHEPGTGGMDYNSILRFLNSSSYIGNIGLEYIPKGKSEDSFGWMNGTL